MAKVKILNQNDPEKIMEKDLAKKRDNLLKEFNLSRDEFIAWHVKNVGAEVRWTNPVTAWIFAAWTHSSGVEEWLTEKERAVRQAKSVGMLKSLKTRAKGRYAPR